MEEGKLLESNCRLIRGLNATGDPMPSWRCNGKPVNQILPSSCGTTSNLHLQETGATHLQQNTQEPHDSTIFIGASGALETTQQINDCDALISTSGKDCSFCGNAIGERASLSNLLDYRPIHDRTGCGDEPVDEFCILNKNSTEKRKAYRIPSIPALIVSDTSTGQNNCVIKSVDLLTFSHANDNTDQISCETTGNRPLSPTVLSVPGAICNDEGMAEPENVHRITDPTSANEHMLLSPRRSCDSAYGSCMDSGLSIPQDDASTSSSIGDADINTDITSSGTASLSSVEDSPNHTTIGRSLCVSMPRKNRTDFSSSSSIASDSATEASTTIDETGSGANLTSDLSSLQIDKEALVRKTSSSSTFSLRSSLSFEESEEDFTSGDDGHANLARRNSKAKAQSSWTKIRRMVIWSPFMQSFKKKYPWVQLAGHAGNFQPGDEGCILKKYAEREAECLKGLTSDPNLQDYAPTFHGVVHVSDEKYTRMQDLLLTFDCPSLMDCKMGIRTYLEDELVKAKMKPRLRHDMYLKMVEISPDEPTEEERREKAVTKPRYMQWREQVSSTSNLGFRIEGIKKSGKDPSKDYKLTKTVEQVTEAFKYFIDSNVSVLEKYIERLKEMRATLETSDYFHSHEAIGSSLLFVHDDSGLANVWMIDFGKTSRLPGNQRLDHRSEWVEGNREDGYLFGMDNMINVYLKILDGLRRKEMIDTSAEVRCKNAVKAVVDITVTAPSPVTTRKEASKRQSAHPNTDDDVTTDDLAKRTS